MLQKIYLHGPLQKVLPEPIEVAVTNCHELIRYLKALVPGFWREFRQLDKVAFIKKSGESAEAIELEQLNWMLGDAEEIHIVPVLGGAFAEVTAAMVYEFAVQVAVSMAASYAVSYILQSMQKTPETENLQPEQASTIFNGGKTLDRQGQRVPLVYGRCMVNGVRVNIGYEAVDASLGQSDYISLDPGNSGTLNVFANDKNLVSPVVVNFTINGQQTAAGGTYTAPFSAYTVQVLANGQVNITSGSNASALDVVVEIYATDNGLSIPQKLHIAFSYIGTPPEFGA